MNWLLPAHLTFCKTAEYKLSHDGPSQVSAHTQSGWKSITPKVQSLTQIVPLNGYEALAVILKYEVVLFAAPRFGPTDTFHSILGIPRSSILWLIHGFFPAAGFTHSPPAGKL
jgi:hypothetical protein